MTTEELMEELRLKFMEIKPNYQVVALRKQRGSEPILLFNKKKLDSS